MSSLGMVSNTPYLTYSTSPWSQRSLLAGATQSEVWLLVLRNGAISQGGSERASREACETGLISCTAFPSHIWTTEVAPFP
ncbi:mCG148294 [Mus musculus]|nr:mCG148294 [Mus musculus]